MSLGPSNVRDDDHKAEKRDKYDFKGVTNGFSKSPLVSAINTSLYMAAQVLTVFFFKSHLSALSQQDNAVNKSRQKRTLAFNIY